VFNESKSNGGNPDVEDVNLQYQGLEFHYIYLMIMAYLVWLIIPGIGLLYSGLSRRKSALAMLFQSMAVMGVYVDRIPPHQKDYTNKDQCMLPVDVLGLLPRLLSYREPLHWRHGKLRIEERNVGSVSRFSFLARDRLLLIPDALLRLYRTACHWWLFRARSYPSLNDLRFLLGNCGLLPNCMLDLERK
jgi:hypothetical protein